MTQFLASASDVRGRTLPGGVVELSWFYPDDITAQAIVFDVYQATDPLELFRTTCATAVAARVVQLEAAGLVGEHYLSVVARRGDALALPSKPLVLTIAAPRPSTATSPVLSSVATTTPTGVGFPFGITPAGGVFAQGGEALLRGKILQFLLTAPGERVNRPDYGTRLIDLVFDPNSEVLAATMEFTITRALQQAFADDIQLDAVQLTTTEDTLLVDISYLRRSDLGAEQIRIGVPLPVGAAA